MNSRVIPATTNRAASLWTWLSAVAFPEHMPAVPGLGTGRRLLAQSAAVPLQAFTAVRPLPCGRICPALARRA